MTSGDPVGKDLFDRWWDIRNRESVKDRGDGVGVVGLPEESAKSEQSVSCGQSCVIEKLEGKFQTEAGWEKMASVPVGD